MNLRPYQSSAVNAAYDSIKNTSTKSLIHSPTGSGKSFMIKELSLRIMHLNHLIIAPRIHLVDQLRIRLKDLPHGVQCASMGRHDCFSTYKCLIGSFQTVANSSNLNPEVVLVDECHLMGSNLTRLLSEFPNAKIIGFTATPCRGNLLMEHHGWNKEYEVLMQDLINDKFVVPPVSMATEGTSFEEGKDDDAITAEIVSNLCEQILCVGRKKVVVFCKNIRHAKMVERLLRHQGEYNTYLIHSNDDCIYQFDKIAYDEFEQNPDRSWLINVGKVTVGVDIPCIDAVAILRDVTSFATLVQMIGRGLRTHGAKQNCLVFDFGKGTQRFGFINDPTFPEHEEFARRYKLPLVMPCEHCGQLHYSSEMSCPSLQSSNTEEEPKQEKEVRSTLSSNSCQVNLLAWDFKQHPQRTMTIANIDTKGVDHNGLIKARLTFLENHSSYASLVSKSPASLPKIGARVKVSQVKGDLLRIL